MNIAIGKIGKSVLFDPNKWGAHGGDNEPSLIYLALAKHYPQHRFYMIGRSDIKQNRQRIPSNIIDAFDGWSNDYNSTAYGYENVKHIKFDFGIIMSGICSNGVNIPSHRGKTLSCFIRYTSPVYHFLNQTMIPYIVLSPDPRYVVNGRDLYNEPIISFSQFQGTKTYKRWLSPTDDTLVDVSVNTHYCGLEKTYFIGQKEVPYTEKTQLMNIVLNEGGNGGLSRGPMLKEYVLDQFHDIKVFGKWSRPWSDDPRFKGPVKFMKLRSTIAKTKYTFIIPTDIGWVTSKYWEMIHLNVLPFLHPYYDTQHHLPVHPFLRVNSPQELKQKIAFAEEHPGYASDVLDTCKSYIDEEDYSGLRLANNIMRFVI